MSFFSDWEKVIRQLPLKDEGKITDEKLALQVYDQCMQIVRSAGYLEEHSRESLLHAMEHFKQLFIRDYCPEAQKERK